MLKFISALAGAFALSLAAASAEPLTADTVENFIETLEPAEEFGRDLQARGVEEDFAIDLQSGGEEAFTPYSKAVAALESKHPDEHAKLGGIVRPHGFTQESWADAGDRIMVAYIAEKMEAENPQAMQQMASMDRSMIDHMPQEMRAQMEMAFVMFEAVKQADPADRAAVKPHMSKFDAYMDGAIERNN